MTLIRRCINEGYFRARRVHRRSGRSSTADRHPSTEPNIVQRGGHTGDAMKMDVLNRGAVGENDVPRPCYRPAVSATGEEQSSDEVATASRSSTESARRSSNHRPDCASGAETTARQPSKVRRHGVPSTTTNLEQMTMEVTAGLNDLQVRMDGVEQHGTRQHQVPLVSVKEPNVYASRPSTTNACGPSAASWERTGVYQPHCRRE